MEPFNQELHQYKVLRHDVGLHDIKAYHFRCYYGELRYKTLAYAGFQATGVLYGVLNDEIRSKIANNRLILLFFALDPLGALSLRTPGYADVKT